MTPVHPTRRATTTNGEKHTTQWDTGPFADACVNASLPLPSLCVGDFCFLRPNTLLERRARFDHHPNTNTETGRQHREKKYIHTSHINTASTCVCVHEVVSLLSRVRLPTSAPNWAAPHVCVQSCPTQHSPSESTNQGFESKVIIFFSSSWLVIWPTTSPRVYSVVSPSSVPYSHRDTSSHSIDVTDGRSQSHAP